MTAEEKMKERNVKKENREKVRTLKEKDRRTN